MLSSRYCDEGHCAWLAVNKQQHLSTSTTTTSEGPSVGLWWYSKAAPQRVLVRRERPWLPRPSVRVRLRVDAWFPPQDVANPVAPAVRQLRGPRSVTSGDRSFGFVLPTLKPMPTLPLRASCKAQRRQRLPDGNLALHNGSHLPYHLDHGGFRVIVANVQRPGEHTDRKTTARSTTV